MHKDCGKGTNGEKYLICKYNFFLKVCITSGKNHFDYFILVNNHVYVCVYFLSTNTNISFIKMAKT